MPRRTEPCPACCGRFRKLTTRPVCAHCRRNAVTAEEVKSYVRTAETPPAALAADREWRVRLYAKQVGRKGTGQIRYVRAGEEAMAETFSGG